LSGPLSAGGPVGSGLADGATDPLGLVLGGGSLAAPELGLVVDPSGPLGAVMGSAPVSVLGVDAAGLPPLSDVGPLEEGLSFVDDDEPESLGSSSDEDEEDEPESLEPPGDGSGSLGDIGAGLIWSDGDVAAFATSAPAQSNPTERPATKAARTTRCGDANVATPGTPLQRRRLQSVAVTHLQWRCQPSRGGEVSWRASKA
jgi:hypothetical protein